MLSTKIGSRPVIHAQVMEREGVYYVENKGKDHFTTKHRKPRLSRIGVFCFNTVTDSRFANQELKESS